MAVMRVVSGRLQVVCAVLLLLAAGRIAAAAASTPAPATSVRAALR